MNDALSSAGQRGIFNADQTGNLPAFFKENDLLTLTKTAAEICAAPYAAITFFAAGSSNICCNIALSNLQAEDVFILANNTLAVDFFEITNAKTNASANNHPLKEAETAPVFFAAVPLKNQNGAAAGAFCVFGMEVHQLSAAQRHMLESFAALIMVRLAVYQNNPSLNLKAHTPQTDHVLAQNNDIHLQTLLDTMNEGVAITDGLGNILYANKTAGQILGVENTTALNLDKNNKWQNKHLDGTIMPFKENPAYKAIASGQTLYNQEFTMQPNGGAAIYLLMNSAPIIDANQQITGSLNTFIDVTARKVLHNAIDLLNQSNYANPSIYASAKQKPAADNFGPVDNQWNLELEYQLEQRIKLLLTAEEQLKIAMAAARMSNWTLNLQTNELILPEAYRLMTGLPLNGEIILADILGLVEPEYINVLNQAIKEAIDTGSDPSFEYPIKHLQTGSRVWIKCVGKLFYDNYSKPHLLIGINVDITEQKDILEEINYVNEELNQSNEELAASLEELQTTNEDLISSQQNLSELNSELEHRVIIRTSALFASEQKLQLSNEELMTTNEELLEAASQQVEYNQNLLKLNRELESARIAAETSERVLNLAISAAKFGTWNIDTETRKLVSSDRLKELFGFFPEDEPTLQDCIAQITDDYRDKVNIAIEKAIAGGGNYDIFYTVRGFHDAELRWLRALGNLKTDNNGEFTVFTGVIMDITEEKADEQRKNDFIAMVSHELKTPLTSLNGYLQMALGKAIKADDQLIVSALTRSITQIKKMTTLINGFLNVARLESGKIQVDKSRFDMADLVKETEDEVTATIKSHKIIFKPVEETIVIADRDKIGQVINNFISNAVKYSPAGSTIRIACVTNAGLAQVSVQDEGFGISSDDQIQLFNRFYRVKNNNNIAGFGIGLYLCSEIIHRHQGKIWVNSKPEQGSTFYFTLPIA